MSRKTSENCQSYRKFWYKILTFLVNCQPLEPKINQDVCLLTPKLTIKRLLSKENGILTTKMIQMRLSICWKSRMLCLSPIFPRRLMIMPTCTYFFLSFPPPIYWRYLKQNWRKWKTKEKNVEWSKIRPISINHGFPLFSWWINDTIWQITANITFFNLTSQKGDVESSTSKAKTYCNVRMSKQVSFYKRRLIQTRQALI